MGVNLLGANNARIDYSGVGLGSLTDFSVAVTVTMSALANGQNLISQWGNLDAERAFVLQIIDTNEIFLGLHDITNVLRGSKTAATDLQTGVLYRIVATRSPAEDINIYVNGVDQSAANMGSPWNGALSRISDASTNLQIGHESDEATDGPDGDYSEVAIWGRRLQPAECQAYGRGVSPAYFREGGIFYVPLENLQNLRDVWGGKQGTNTAGTLATHPAVDYPSSFRPLIAGRGAA